MSSKKEVDELPAVVIDTKNGRQYRRGKFLGKGGFARCYELQDMITNEVFAGKVVSKTLLQKEHQREKMQMEISIHRTLSHRNVVKFISYFEDAENVYIVLELCRRRSLMELHKRRKTVTSPEARYFLRQIVLAVKYLHDAQVIHRDLKLGNLFLNDEMEVKIGDFGLATRIEHDGERKRTLCGTPNYIAPEVLYKRGHSFEVDAWSIGCILYTLLVGKPPFETTSLKETYDRIKRNVYTISPQTLLAQTPHAGELVRLLLSPNPQDRPSMAAILDHPFFSGFIPSALPVSCLSNAPRFDTIPRVNDINLHAGTLSGAQFNAPLTTAAGVATGSIRRPLDTMPLNGAQHQPTVLGDAVRNVVGGSSNSRGGPSNAAMAPSGTSIEPVRNPAATSRDPVGYVASGTNGGPESEAECIDPTASADCGLGELHRQVRLCLAGMEKKLQQLNGAPLRVMDEMIEDPACAPIYWVSKWVDYSDKYGLGYQLCDNSVGVLFNDSTRLLLASNAENIQYIEKNGTEHLYTLQLYPEKTLQKKVTLLRYFRSYMNEHLLRAGGDRAPREADGMTRLPFMKSWFRTRTAIVMLLSNGTLQINFFDDHIKIILCPVMEAVTLLDANHIFHTYRFALIHDHGAPAVLTQKLKYAQNMIAKLSSRVAMQNATASALSSVASSAVGGAQQLVTESVDAEPIDDASLVIGMLDAGGATGPRKIGQPTAAPVAAATSANRR